MTNSFQAVLSLWMIFWHKRYIYVRPVHLPLGLNALSQANISLELLSLRLQKDRHTTSEDHIDFPHLTLIVSVGTLKTGYLRIQALSQDKEQGVHPHAAI
jgi:hypothetical protein